MKKRGFTLIELVAVLGIISLVSAVAIMRFNILDKLKTNMELQNLINDCDYAKMKAISTGEDYVLLFDKNSYNIVAASKYVPESDISRDLNKIYISQHNMSKKEIRFTKSGTVAYAGTIVIKDGKSVEREKDVSVDINVPECADDDKLVELRVRVGLGYVRYKK